MSEFEDNLWLAVVREHGHELTRATQTVRAHRHASRPQLLAGTTMGLAAIATTTTLLLSASSSSPAFAVTRNPNGTVTVNLRKASGIASANDRLAAMGVRAQIVISAKSAPEVACSNGTVPTITLDPASIPKRQVLIITSGKPSANDVPPPKAANANANMAPGVTSGVGNNHVVRINPGSGRIQMKAAGQTNHVVRMYCR